MNQAAPPEWQLPPGVSRGTWDYAHHASVADDYDDYFAFNELFQFDEAVATRVFDPPGTLVDLGCGSGRALLPFVRHGFRGIAVDYSPEMLRVVRAKAAEDSLPIECVQANLVELDADHIPDDTADYAMCLFSTLGMIRGRVHRRAALGQVFRFLKPGGRFVVHAHNFWFNLFDPGGPWWLVRNLWDAATRRSIERGDKYFLYRGVPNMFLHVYTRGGFRKDLTDTGFVIREFIPLATSRQKPLPHTWLLPGIRANGWIAVCEKAGAHSSRHCQGAEAKHCGDGSLAPPARHR